jgi:hypothetical protein
MNYPKVADAEFNITISDESIALFDRAIAAAAMPFVSVWFDGESLGFTPVTRVRFVKGHWRSLSHTTFCRKLKRKLRAAHKR